LYPRRTASLVLVVASLFLLGPSFSCRHSQSDPRLASTRAALGKGETQRALELANDYLRDQPSSSEAMDLKGLALQAMGRAEAEQAFREAIRLLPSRPEPRDHLASILYQSGRRQEAARQWQEAIQADSNYAPAHYNLGSVYQAEGRLDEAAAQFREALRLNPDLTQARINLGIALVSLGRFPEAEKELRESVRLAPHDPEAAFNLGAALVSARKTDEGVRELRRALSLRQDFAEAHERIATAYFYDGKLDQAEGEFRQALSIRPDYADAYLGLGVLLTEQGKEDEAIRQYEKALAIEPTHRAASINLALLYGRKDKAPPSAVNRVAAFEIYRRGLLDKNWEMAWQVLSTRSKAIYLDDPSRFRYAAQKGFDNPPTRERLSSPSFFLRYLEPPAPDPSSGLPYDPGRIGAVEEGPHQEWRVELLVLSALPSPDPQR
jgi:tetratricopeptide (TPR) repeat protein